MRFIDLPSARAQRDPEAPALRDDAGSYTNRGFLDAVNAAAGALAAAGVRRGDVVGLLLPNRRELVVALFAAWALGAAVTPVNPVLGPAEARYQLEDAGARLVVTDEDRGTLGVPVLAVERLSDTPGDAVRAEVAAGENGPAAEHDLALLIYTSGTTGRPKGVMLEHANLDAMTAGFVEWFGLTEADHSLLVLPLFHANGIVLGTLSALRAGGQVSIVGRFSRDRFFEDVQRLRPSYFSAVPAIYAMLNGLPEGEAPDVSSVRFAVCGAAPMPREAIARFEGRFGITIVEGYGLSETTTASTINPLAGPRKPGTVGLALPGQRVLVVDAEGAPVPAGERGEVVISGPVVMRGYLNRPEETAKTLVDGWLHTGDIGVFDDEGYLSIVDRIKDMIIRGGENIYPKEIENALYTHPGVVEAAVVGRAHPVLGEEPIAFVALTPDAAGEAGEARMRDELRALGERELAPFKRPVEIVILPALPKNPVGKIDKPALRVGLPA